MRTGATFGASGRRVPWIAVSSEQHQTRSKQVDEQGFDAEAFLSTLGPRPGVYRMIDARGQVIYVGKARNLKKRVSSYFGAKG